MFSLIECFYLLVENPLDFLWGGGITWLGVVLFVRFRYLHERFTSSTIKIIRLMNGGFTNRLREHVAHMQSTEVNVR